MSDRILICDVCGKEKPDYETKAVINWGYRGSYLDGGFWCPYCHCKTSTIIKSSKGTPETGDYTFENLPIYYTYSHAEYGDKSDADFIADVKKIRARKKQKAEEERLKKEYYDRIDNLWRRLDNKFEEYLKKYKSEKKAYMAANEWINKNKELADYMKKNNLIINPEDYK